MTPLRAILTSLFLLSCAACSDPPKEQSPPPDECPTGDRGCDCNADNTCAGDLTCFNGVCLAEDDIPDQNPDPNPDEDPDPSPGPNPDPNPDPDPGPNPDPFEGLGLGLDNSDVRACEVVLKDPQNKIGEVVFDSDSVEGRFMRRGERIALAFHSKGGAEIADGAVGFTPGNGAMDLEGIEVVVGQCVDAQGQPLAEVEVTVIDRR